MSTSAVSGRIFHRVTFQILPQHQKTTGTDNLGTNREKSSSVTSFQLPYTTDTLQVKKTDPYFPKHGSPKGTKQTMAKFSLYIPNWPKIREILPVFWIDLSHAILITHTWYEDWVWIFNWGKSWRLNSALSGQSKQSSTTCTMCVVFAVVENAFLRFFFSKSCIDMFFHKEVVL